MSIVPLADAKARLSELADEVYRTHERIRVTRNGREFVVIMSTEDLESLEATIELLADRDAQESIAQSERDIAAGEGTPLAEMAGPVEERRCSGR